MASAIATDLLKLNSENVADVVVNQPVKKPVNPEEQELIEEQNGALDNIDNSKKENGIAPIEEKKDSAQDAQACADLIICCNEMLECCLECWLCIPHLICCDGACLNDSSDCCTGCGDCCDGACLNDSSDCCTGCGDCCVD